MPDDYSLSDLLERRPKKVFRIERFKNIKVKVCNVNIDVIQSSLII